MNTNQYASNLLMFRETEWYRRHGKHPQRIVKTRDEGTPYPIGDRDWNRQHPDNPEHIGELMKRDGVYDGIVGASPPGK